jgi:hypothetical protein
MHKLNETEIQKKYEELSFHLPGSSSHTKKCNIHVLGEIFFYILELVALVDMISDLYILRALVVNK